MKEELKSSRGVNSEDREEKDIENISSRRVDWNKGSNNPMKGELLRRVGKREEKI
jgi:hypothetical protein